MTRPPPRPESREPWPSDGHDAHPFVAPGIRRLDEAHRNYVEAGGTLDRATHDARVDAFGAALHDAWAGIGSVERVLDHARPLLIDGPRLADHRRYPPPPVDVPDEAMLARIATDLVPAIGNAAPDRLLGPWAAQPCSPRLLQVAVAAGLFMAPDDLPMTALRRWAGRTPVPPVEERQRVRAVLQAPYTAWPLLAQVRPGLWSVGAPVGGGEPLEAVRVPAPAVLPGGPPPAPGHTLLARVVCTATEAIACCPVVVPMPVPASSEGWVDLLTLRHRLHDRRASTADVLRHRGHHLVLRVLEAAWLA